MSEKISHSSFIISSKENLAGVVMFLRSFRGQNIDLKLMYCAYDERENLPEKICGLDGGLPSSTMLQGKEFCCCSSSGNVTVVYTNINDPYSWANNVEIFRTLALAGDEQTVKLFLMPPAQMNTIIRGLQIPQILTGQAMSITFDGIEKTFKVKYPATMLLSR